MSVRPRRALVAAGALLVAVLLAPPATGATEPEPPAGETASTRDLVSFGISPGRADRPDDRPYLSMEAPAGAVVYEHVALINQDDQPLTLDVYGTDVVMAEGGGITARARADASTDAGAWLTVDGPTSVEVPPQTVDTGFGFAIVPFRVTIPANAEPGDHVAGLVASLVSKGVGGENSPGIDFEQRVVARVYVRVAGALDPHLEISDVTAAFVPGPLLSAGSVSVSYTLGNTGNVRMAVAPEVALAGPFGLLGAGSKGDRVDELMPGGSVEQTTTVSGVWPLVRETVTVSATALAATNGTDPGIGTVSTTVSVQAVPWAALVILVTLLLGLALLEVRRRRRAARRARRAALRAARLSASPWSDAPAVERSPESVAVGTGSRQD